ncbi:hypothetical protein FOL47_008527 [Perkinsus chesapeaki]|uniref:Uncharacterized protein n=1 Tax=Perkinsus chesapeaki TaxID=330153 RepID=A0A7J6LDV8_PERCH|nr:hypothetical protein FOL47_008527 [Perkinsus chesapeaki]
MPRPKPGGKQEVSAADLLNKLMGGKGKAHPVASHKAAAGGVGTEVKASALLAKLPEPSGGSGDSWGTVAQSREEASITVSNAASSSAGSSFKTSSRERRAPGVEASRSYMQSTNSGPVLASSTTTQQMSSSQMASSSVLASAVATNTRLQSAWGSSATTGATSTISDASSGSGFPSNLQWSSDSSVKDSGRQEAQESHRSGVDATVKSSNADGSWKSSTNSDAFGNTTKTASQGFESSKVASSNGGFESSKVASSNGGFESSKGGFESSKVASSNGGFGSSKVASSNGGFGSSKVASSNGGFESSKVASSNGGFGSSKVASSNGGFGSSKVASSNGGFESSKVASSKASSGNGGFSKSASSSVMESKESDGWGSDKSASEEDKESARSGDSSGLIASVSGSRSIQEKESIKSSNSRGSWEASRSNVASTTGGFGSSKQATSVRSSSGFEASAVAKSSSGSVVSNKEITSTKASGALSGGWGAESTHSSGAGRTSSAAKRQRSEIEEHSGVAYSGSVMRSAQSVVPQPLRVESIVMKDEGEQTDEQPVKLVRRKRKVSPHKKRQPRGNGSPVARKRNGGFAPQRDGEEVLPLRRGVSPIPPRRPEHGGFLSGNVEGRQVYKFNAPPRVSGGTRRVSPQPRSVKARNHSSSESSIRYDSRPPWRIGVSKAYIPEVPPPVVPTRSPPPRTKGRHMQPGGSSKDLTRWDWLAAGYSSEGLKHKHCHHNDPYGSNNIHHLHDKGRSSTPQQKVSVRRDVDESTYYIADHPSLPAASQKDIQQSPQVIPLIPGASAESPVCCWNPVPGGPPAAAVVFLNPEALGELSWVIPGATGGVSDGSAPPVTIVQNAADLWRIIANGAAKKETVSTGSGPTPRPMGPTASQTASLQGTTLERLPEEFSSSPHPEEADEPIASGGGGLLKPRGKWSLLAAGESTQGAMTKHHHGAHEPPPATPPIRATKGSPLQSSVKASSYVSGRQPDYDELTPVLASHQFSSSMNGSVDQADGYDPDSRQIIERLTEDEYTLQVDGNTIATTIETDRVTDEVDTMQLGSIELTTETQEEIITKETHSPGFDRTEMDVFTVERTEAHHITRNDANDNGTTGYSGTFGINSIDSVKEQDSFNTYSNTEQLDSIKSSEEEQVSSSSQQRVGEEMQLDAADSSSDQESLKPLVTPAFESANDTYREDAIASYRSQTSSMRSPVQSGVMMFGQPIVSPRPFNASTVQRIDEVVDTFEYTEELTVEALIRSVDDQLAGWERQLESYVYGKDNCTQVLDFFYATKLSTWEQVRAIREAAATSLNNTMLPDIDPVELAAVEEQLLSGAAAVSSYLASHTHFTTAIAANHAERCFHRALQITQAIGIGRLASLGDTELRALWVLAQSTTKAEFRASAYNYIQKAEQYLSLAIRSLESALAAWRMPIEGNPPADISPLIDSIVTDHVRDYRHEKLCLRALMDLALTLDDSIMEIGSGLGHNVLHLNDTGLVAAYGFEHRYSESSAVTRGAVTFLPGVTHGSVAFPYGPFDWGLVFNVFSLLSGNTTTQSEELTNLLRNIGSHTREGVVLFAWRDLARYSQIEEIGSRFLDAKIEPVTSLRLEGYVRRADRRDYNAVPMGVRAWVWRKGSDQSATEKEEEES